MKKIYSSSFVKLYSEDFKYKKKFYKNFHKIILNNAAVVILKNKNKVLLIFEYRRGVKKILPGLPGGHIKKNEKPIKAAKRELFEELNLKGKNWKLLFSYVNSTTYNCGYEYVFTADLNSDLKFLDKSNEIENFKWVTKRELKKIVTSQSNLSSGFIASTLFYLNSSFYKD